MILYVYMFKQLRFDCICLPFSSGTSLWVFVSFSFSETESCLLMEDDLWKHWQFYRSSFVPIVFHLCSALSYLCRVGRWHYTNFAATQFPLLSMPSSVLGSIPCCWAIFCTSKPMCFRNWITLISCPVSWSRIVGQDGLQWGHGQLSIKCRGQPLVGRVLCFWWLWLLLLMWLLSWRLRSQQWRALGKEVPFTWMSIQ